MASCKEMFDYWKKCNYTVDYIVCHMKFKAYDAIIISKNSLKYFLVNLNILVFDTLP